jgi:hypothetical protein
LNNGTPKKRKKEEKKNLHKIMATFVSASNQGKSTHSARTIKYKTNAATEHNLNSELSAAENYMASFRQFQKCQDG